MQPYQNYFAAQMPQYQPVYNPAAQQSNPYLDRLNNLQQYQQTLQQPQQVQMPVLNGRIVDSFDSITANDVPMSGNAVFIKSDGSEIQIRAWGKMGNIEKTSYKPFTDVSEPKEDKSTVESAESPTSALNVLTEDIMKRFDDIESRLEELKKSATPKTTARAKKESDS